MKHTSGPYKRDWLKNGGCNIDPEDGHGRIATVWVRYSKSDNLAEVAANAHLISSAPELLEALKDTTEQLGLYLSSIEDGKDDDAESAYQYGLAMIAKAERR